MKREELKAVLKAQKELYVKPDDRILFVVDEGYKNAPIGEIFAGYEHQIVHIPQIERPGQDYELNKKFLENKTLAWLIASVSISHSPMSVKMMEWGMFLISNPGISPDWLAILDPQNREVCRERAETILKAIGGDIGGAFMINANDGTNLWLKIPSKNWIKETGEREGFGTNGPYGELATAPFWAKGTYVLRPGDFATNPLNEIKEEIRLTIEENQVVKIEGESQAKTLQEMLEKAGNPKAYSLGEFALGINPGRPSRVYRSVIAEKLKGGIHIAIGTNALCLQETCPELDKFQYGRYNAGVHIDCIKFSASVTFISRERTDVPVTILKKGEFVV